VFFPESLELMIRDLSKLGLIDFDILEITETRGLEFFVYLRKNAGSFKFTDSEFYEQRHRLLVEISKKLGIAPFLNRHSPAPLNT
jgi:hypothetical protein